MDILTISVKVGSFIKGGERKHPQIPHGQIIHLEDKACIKYQCSTILVKTIKITIQLHAHYVSNVLYSSFLDLTVSYSTGTRKDYQSLTSLAPGAAHFPSLQQRYDPYDTNEKGL